MSGWTDTFRAWIEARRGAESSARNSDEPSTTENDPLPTIEANARVQSPAVTGIFVLMVLYTLYFAAPILIPIASALLLSMLLAPLVRLLEVGRVPRSLGALIVVVGVLVSLVGVGLSLRGPVQSWLTDAPERLARLEERLRPITSLFEKVQAAGAQLERVTAPKDSPSIQTVSLARPGLAGLLSSGSPHVVSTVIAVIGLLYLFLVSGDTFLRKLVAVIPTLKDKKRAVEIVRSIENDISFYLVLITVINVVIGLAIAVTTAVLGIADPLLWGTLAAILSFAPYVGEFVIVVMLTLAGLLSFDGLARAFVAPVVYFVLMTLCWQGVVPIIVGRRMTLSPVAVFVMILFLGWMWGVVGALVAVPMLASLKIICERVQSLHRVAEFLTP